MALPYFDILSPIDEFMARLQYGKMHRFYYYTTSAYNGYRVEKLLRRYGIRVWGRRIQGDTRSFIVKRKQAVWAEYLLCRAGVPLACDEPADFRTFRIGLFGLDKLKNVERTVATFERALDALA